MIRKKIFVGVIVISALAFPGLAETGPAAPSLLTDIQKRLETALNALDTSLAQSANEIAKTGLQGAGAVKVLNELCAANPMAVDCAILDSKGRMLLLEPDEYKKIKGADVGSQEQIKRLHLTGKPVLSMVFKSVEGINAIDLEYPVLGPKGEMKGSVSVLIRPEPFLREILSGITEGWDILVIETNGRILFSTDHRSIDQNILTEPSFNALPVKKIVDDPNGSVTFTGSHGDPSGELFWTSTGLHGTSWRVLVSREARPVAGKILDLTYPYDDNAIYWPTADSFKVTRVFRGINEKGYWYASNNYSASEHGGTHADAPMHFAQGGRTMEQVPVGEWIGPAAKIDVTVVCEKNRDYMLTVDDILNWESQHGRLPAHAWVIMYTGLDTKWYPDKIKVLGTDLRGPEALPLLSFPGFSPEVATFLVNKRNIAGIALDTPSIDYGKSADFQVHRIICGADKLALENVAGLDQLPETGAMLYAIPMTIRDGTGAPVRIFAILP